MKLQKILGLCLMAFWLAFAGCDQCRNVDCENGGACVDGNCDCAEGYEEADCGTEIRSKFLGTFNISDACNSGTGSYNVTSTAGDGILEIKLTNLYNSNNTIVGTISDTQVTFAKQSFGSFNMEGTGSITGTTLTINFTILDGFNDTCVSTGEKVL